MKTMNTIKNIYHTIGRMALCCLGALCTACSDFLEIKQMDEIILEDFWTGKEDVDNVVNGCYAALLDAGVRERMIMWGEGRSDNVAGGRDKVNQTNIYNVLRENITAMNAFTTWDGFYRVINRCNTVLKYAVQVGDADPSYTRSDLYATVGEMKALRALCYFYLIRTFRDVPYSTTAYTDDDQKMDLPATPFYSVLDSLINDLEEVKGQVVTRYPETEPRDQTGRITRDAVYAMLSEMYLWKKDYDNCIRYADMVIQSKKDAFMENVNKSTTISARMAEQMLQRTNGYPLVTDNLSGSIFGDAYRDIFVRGNSTETIFELVYASTPKASGQVANTGVENLYGNGRYNTGFLIASSYVTEDALAGSDRKVFEDANKGLDSRLYTNLNTNNGNITKLSTSYQQIMLPSELTVAKIEENVTKTNGRTYYDEGNNGTNWIVYRLPDIMLLEAEALCQQMREGSDSAALAYNKPLADKVFNLVNAINKRSIMKGTLQDADTLKRASYNTRTQLEELVIRERQRELMFEGKRYYDLVRYSLRDGNTDYITSVMTRRDDVNKSYVGNFFRKMDAIFWPYNYEEMRVNRNLVPNPAFGTGENESYEKTAK